jgi:hypothetical protein
VEAFVALALEDEGLVASEAADKLLVPIKRRLEIDEPVTFYAAGREVMRQA